MNIGIKFAVDQWNDIVYFTETDPDFEIRVQDSHLYITNNKTNMGFHVQYNIPVVQES